MTTPDWLNDAVFYQIFPERFANGDPSLDPDGVEPWGAQPTRDNFFGGDLAGITAHLDHIQSVGANAIYLTPIFEADTNHRYDATDYFAIDHRLGDLAAFQRFLAAAHERGMRVVLDAVLNHCGDGHPFFRDAVEKQAASDYTNWFSIEGYPVVAHPEPNYRTCSGCYYLPKWNAYNPLVRQHHLDVARYWIEQGIDGWRLDVPYFINHSFWREFRQAVKGLGDDKYIVAEEWREPEQWLQGDLADGTMNYTLRDLVLGFTADSTVSGAQYAQGMAVLTERIPRGYHAGMLNLLGSHDTERVLTRHSDDHAAARLAYALLLTAQGAPMIYYGDEVGMVGDNDPGCRGTMPWDRAEWHEDLLGWIQQLTAARSELTALRRGSQRVVAIDDDVVAVIREHESTAAVAIVNRGASPAVVAVDRLPVGQWRVVAGEASLSGASIAVPPLQAAVLTTQAAQ
jgi:cyclomaltodextrinase / maltogenic alpha-amylase / neopullulanase